MNLRDGLRSGAIAFAVLLYFDLLGLPRTFGSPTITIFVILVVLLAILSLRDRPRKEFTPLSATINGTILGFIAGLGISLVTFLFAQMQANGIQVKNVFAQIFPEHTAALTGLTPEEVVAGASPIPGLLQLTLILTIAGLVGGALTRLITERTSAYRERLAESTIAHWSALGVPFIFFVLFLVLRVEGVDIAGSDENIVGLVLIFLFIAASLFALRSAKSGRERIIFALLVLALVLVTPQLTDLFQNAILGAVAIFIVMGIGLNIVVGYAGLLDLGYVAFFGIGAYTYALLSAPESYVLVNVPGFYGLTFWGGLPVAILMGVTAGVLLGIPVLRMRGDYLAIVTLGFGEIIRLLFLNLRDYTGGPGGVLDVPAPIVFGLNLGNPKGILYLAMFFGAVAAFLTIRLRDSRLGRAWVALREDEDVAQAMGINLVAIKLLAFASGAAFAAAAGALYAARQVNIFPDNFTLLVSIDVLSLIIIGGMGSLEGVVLGSIALVGLPEILRSVNEYRIVAFGALLVIMMILRPEGLLPSARRMRELRVEQEEEVESASASD
jgi:branched-chain amino acid transport system permease protein